MLQEALRLAELGYQVFPCFEKLKFPDTPHGCNDATSDVKQIEKWWTKSPNANIGLSTYGLIVIDIDPTSDGSANKWPLTLPDSPDLDARAIAVTPRRGRHFYFKAPDNSDYRNSSKKLAASVDVRANGGYVLLPPSHVCMPAEKIDGSYFWAVQLDMPAGQLSLPPEWLLAELDRIGANKSAAGMFATSRRLSVETTSRISVPSIAVAPAVLQESDANAIPDGQRNDTLMRMGSGFRRIGMSQPEILAALHAINVNRCKPPLPRKEVETIAWSVSRYEPDQAATAVAEGWAVQDGIGVNRIAGALQELEFASDTGIELEEHHSPYEDDRHHRIPDPGPFPADLLRVPGLIGEIIDWNLETAYKRQPELALAGALSLLSVLTGRKVRDETNCRTNLYCLGVCESGGGKEHARQINKAILRHCGVDDRYIGPEGFKSDAGLVCAVDENPAILFQVDEIGRWLKVAQDPRAGHLYQIITALLKFYSSANSSYKGDAYAEKSKTKTIYFPHAVLFGTSVPKSFFDALTPENLTDGFLSRLMIFEASDNDPPQQQGGIGEVPYGIEVGVKNWLRFGAGSSVFGDAISKSNEENKRADYSVLVTSSADANARFDQLERDSRARRTQDRAGCETALWTRLVEKARKLAMLWACSMDGQDLLVTADAADWACRVVWWQAERLEYLAFNFLAENEWEDDCNRVLRAIREGGLLGLTSRVLLDRTRWLATRQRREVLEYLEGRGDISISKSPPKGKKGGRQSVVYRFVPPPTFQ